MKVIHNENSTKLLKSISIYVKDTKSKQNKSDLITIRKCIVYNDVNFIKKNSFFFMNSSDLVDYDVKNLWKPRN